MAEAEDKESAFPDQFNKRKRGNISIGDGEIPERSSNVKRLRRIEKLGKGKREDDGADKNLEKPCITTKRENKIDWRKISFLDRNTETQEDGLSYGEEHEKMMMMSSVIGSTTARKEPVGVIIENVAEKGVSSVGVKQKCESKIYDHSLNESSDQNLNWGFRNFRKSNMDMSAKDGNQEIDYGRTCEDEEAVPIQGKRKYGFCASDSETDISGNCVKRQRICDHGSVEDDDQKLGQIGSAYQDHHEIINQWRRFRRVNNLQFSIESYETELDNSEDEQMFTVMVGGATDQPIQFRKQKLRVKGTPSVTENAATEAIRLDTQIPVHDIRGLQVLPQPPIAPKFYSDRYSRKELKTWLWHPTDKRREMKWLKARRGSWSLDCDGGFREGSYGRFGSVIRDDEGGREVFVYGMSPNIVSPLYHEIECIYWTSQVAWSLGIRRITIRTDNLRAVELLTKPNVIASIDEGQVVRDLVAKVKAYLERHFSGEGFLFRIRHQYREMSNLADYVAGLCNGTKTTPVIVFGSFDATTAYFLGREAAGLAYYWDRDRLKAEKKAEDERRKLRRQGKK